MTTDREEITRLKQEAFSVRRMLSLREDEARDLTMEISLLTPIYKEVEAGGDVDMKKLSEHGVVLSQPFSSLEKLVVKSKIGGIIAQKTEVLRKVQSDIANLRTLLGQLSTCPRCGGAGTKTRVRYEREDSRIQAGETVDDCAFCGGRGIIELD